MNQSRLVMTFYFLLVCTTVFLTEMPVLLVALVCLGGLLGLWGVFSFPLGRAPAQLLYWTVGAGLGIPLFRWLVVTRADDPYWKLALVALGMVGAVWQALALLITGTRHTTILCYGLLALFGSLAGLSAMHPAMQVLWVWLLTFVFVFAAEACHEHAGYLAGQGWRRRFLVIAVAVAGVLLLHAPVEYGFIRLLTLTQTWAEETIAAEGTRERGVRAYARVATLDSVAFEQRNESYATAVRVRASFRPGYLRGAAYDTFRGRQWLVGDRRASELRGVRLIRKQTHETLQGILPDNLYRLDDRSVFPIHEETTGPWHHLEINNQPRRGEMYFLPMEADYVQGTGSQIWLDRHGAVTRGLSVNRSYRVYLNETPQRDALDSSDTFRLTQIPPELVATISTLAKSIAGDATTPSEQVQRVRNYFRSRYQHSLDGFEVPRGTHQIEYFLREQPAAHCEYFASSTIFLLRALNIPARYATGYLALEQDDEDSNLWEARNRDAHAWAEWYDRETGLWQIIESTPGVSAPLSLAEALAEAQAKSGATGAAGDLIEQLDNEQTWFTFRFSPQEALQFFSWLALATILIGGCLLAWYWYQAIIRPNRFGAERVRLQKLLARVDRKLSRYHFVRASHETLRQFVARLRASEKAPDWLPQAAAWYDDYSQLVYRREPSPLDVAELARRVP